jgi:cobalt-zinc-cadmium resistance protein CzcA
MNAVNPLPPNVSDTFVMLKPRSEWPNLEEPKSALVERMGEALLKVSGTNYTLTRPIQMRFSELIGGVRREVDAKVYGENSPDMENRPRRLGHTPRCPRW